MAYTYSADLELLGLYLPLSRESYRSLQVGWRTIIVNLEDRLYEIGSIT